MPTIHIHRRYFYFAAGIIFIVVIASLFLYFLMQERGKQEKQEVQNKIIQNKINQIEQDVIKNFPIGYKDTSGNAIVGLSDADRGFLITYFQEDHKFKIDLEGRDLEQEKKAAEEFLLNEVFKTRDTAIVCSIKVSFVDVSPASRIDEELSKVEAEKNGLTLEEEKALIDELEQKFGHPKVISEKLSICQ